MRILSLKEDMIKFKNKNNQIGNLAAFETL